MRRRPHAHQEIADSERDEEERIEADPDLRSCLCRIYGAVDVGSPAQSFDLLFDTGSADMWVYADGTGSREPEWDASASSTAVTSPALPWSIRYGRGEQTGYLNQDTVSLGGYDVNNTIFAAASTLNEAFTYYPISGLFGLGFGTISASGCVFFPSSRRTLGPLSPLPSSSRRTLGPFSSRSTSSLLLLLIPHTDQTLRPQLRALVRAPHQLGRARRAVLLALPRPGVGRHDRGRGQPARRTDVHRLCRLEQVHGRDVRPMSLELFPLVLPVLASRS